MANIDLSGKIVPYGGHHPESLAYVVIDNVVWRTRDGGEAFNTPIGIVIDNIVYARPAHTHSYQFLLENGATPLPEHLLYLVENLKISEKAPR